MLSPKQLNYLREVFPEFKPDPHGDAMLQFYRLGLQRGWKEGSDAFRMAYHAFFNKSFESSAEDIAQALNTSLKISKPANGDESHKATSSNSRGGTLPPNSDGGVLITSARHGSATKLTLNNSKPAQGRQSFGVDSSSDSSVVFTPKSDGGVPISTELPKISTKANTHDLKRFFDQDPDFQSQPEKPFLVEFARFAKHKGWPNDRFDESSDEFAAALFSELHHFLGERLPALQQMCKDLRLNVVTDTIPKCQKAIKSVHVNIFTYIDCRRAGRQIAPIHATYSEFVNHTEKHGLICPKMAAKGHIGSRALMKDMP
ncbi:MAG: hypothetical protein M1831_001170 [Alyxoria varia]|nr:MAG: hypothetical protein M1831_001170 [Alyxoria varia]